MRFRSAGFNPPPVPPNPTNNDPSSIVDSTFNNFAGFNRAYQGMTDQAQLAGETFADRAKENAQNILDNAFAKAQVTSAEATRRRFEERSADIMNSIDKDVAQKKASNLGGVIGSGLGLAASFAIPGVGAALGPALSTTIGGGIGKVLPNLFG